VIIAVVVSIIAYWWKVNHWYTYAVLIVIGVAFHQLLEISTPLSFIIPGSIILPSGLAVLIRFLRKYPKLAEEGADDNR